MAFVPENAPFVLLALFLTGLAGLAAGAVIVYSLVVKKFIRAKVTAASGLILAGIYLGTLITFSLLSRERVLAPGEQKYFCEVDCHEAYSVSEVARVKALGDPLRPVAARGTFYLVTLRVWFDERTISSRRAKDMPLGPNPRRAAVVDASGREYKVSEAGQRALAAMRGTEPPLNRPIKPGESYTTTLVFDLPAEVQNPGLLIANDEWPTRFLIGHENSFLHKKVFFQL